MEMWRRCVERGLFPPVSKLPVVLSGTELMDCRTYPATLTLFRRHLHRNQVL